jgi:choice-of-anchor C domain-containing protein
MKKIVLGTLAAIAVAAPLTLAGPAHAATALTNASFEEAAVTLSDVYYVVDANHQDLTGWTAGGAGIDIVDEAYWNADEGSRSIDLNAYGPGSISQKFETEPGQTYDVKFAMSGNPAAQVERGPKTMNVTAANTSAEFIYDTAVAQNTLIDMKYKPQTFSFAATGSSTTLTFASTTETIGDTPDGRKAAFGPVVDDVEVTAAPNVAKTLVWHTWSRTSRPRDGTPPAVTLSRRFTSRRTTKLACHTTSPTTATRAAAPGSSGWRPPPDPPAPTQRPVPLRRNGPLRPHRHHLSEPPNRRAASVTHLLARLAQALN